MDQLIGHSLKALQASLADGELTKESISVAVVGSDLTLTLLDQDAVQQHISALKVGFFRRACLLFVSSSPRPHLLLHPLSLPLSSLPLSLSPTVLFSVVCFDVHVFSLPYPFPLFLHQQPLTNCATQVHNFFAWRLWA
jgi:hypothetical protein